MMKQKKIRLSSVADAKEFVRRAVECDFDVDVFYNRVIIDAKSILGVLSLDLTKKGSCRRVGEKKLPPCRMGTAVFRMGRTGPAVDQRKKHGASGEEKQQYFRPEPCRIYSSVRGSG